MDALADECIIDANVFIDFKVGQILQVLASERFAIATTDFVVAEIDNPSHAELEAIGVDVESLEEDLVSRLISLVAQYQKPSFADLSALVLAEHRRVILVTGDSDLRSAANELEIEVHGTIWLMDRCLDNGSLSRRTAVIALQNMLKNDRRLPHAEVKKRVAAWG